MSKFGDCTFCGGEVEEQKIVYDYRRRGQLLSLWGRRNIEGELAFAKSYLDRVEEVSTKKIAPNSVGAETDFQSKTP